MSSPLHDALRRLAERRDLPADLTAEAFGVIMRGEATPALIGGFLMALRAKGETADEVAGAAQALRASMVRVTPAAGAPVVDTCGTGGGTVTTFNISTAAGLVAAGSGVRVAKHGNRSFTSRSGSADVLEALGVDITGDPAGAAARLDRAGLVFLFAPTYHPAMRHVGPTRKELGVTTIMNLLGPLANPAGVDRQVIGVADAARAPLIAGALARLGTALALVVHGEIGMDEVSPVGRTAVWEVRGREITTWTLDPGRYDLAWERVEDLAGGEPAENAARIERLLAGGTGADQAGRRAVTLNAGAALYVSGVAASVEDAMTRAREGLERGAGREVLDRLRREGRDGEGSSTSL